MTSKFTKDLGLYSLFVLLETLAVWLFLQSGEYARIQDNVSAVMMLVFLIFTIMVVSMLHCLKINPGEGRQLGVSAFMLRNLTTLVPATLLVLLFSNKYREQMSTLGLAYMSFAFVFLLIAGFITFRGIRKVSP